MKGALRTLRAAALVSATTIGAGIFALPYVFLNSGFVVSAIFLFVLAGLLAVIHVCYFRALRAGGDGANLTGLVESLSSNPLPRLLAALSVAGGLLLALSAYLILGAQFLSLVFPLSPPLALAIFWVICTAPFLFRERSLVNIEFLGAGALFALLAFLLVYSITAGDFGRLSSLTLGGTKTPLLVFAPLLFALAGWPAVSEVYAMKRSDEGTKKTPSDRSFERGIVWGTICAAVGYFVFVIAAILLSPRVLPDTLSGLTLSSYLLLTLVLFGLFALWTSYLPEGLEVERALTRGLGIPPALSVMGVTFVPLALILAGLNRFLFAVSLSGGIFVALQYFFLIYTSRRALGLRGGTALLLDVVGMLFFLAAVYEIYRFVVG